VKETGKVLPGIKDVFRIMLYQMLYMYD